MIFHGDNRGASAVGSKVNAWAPLHIRCDHILFIFRETSSNRLIDLCGTKLLTVDVSALRSAV